MSKLILCLLLWLIHAVQFVGVFVVDFAELCICVVQVHSVHPKIIMFIKT